MLILSLMRNIGDIVYQGCKKIYDVTISPIVNLACKILFSEKAAPPERINRTVSHSTDQNAPSTSRVEQLVSPFFPSSPTSPPLNSLPQQLPNTRESNHQNETARQEAAVTQERAIVQEEKEIEEKPVQEEPVKQEDSIVQETIVEEPVQKGLPKTPPKAEKSLITYVGDSDIPYFLNRKGFPNPSARNCTYNSLAVLCAHTGCSIPSIHPDNEELYKQLDNPPQFEEAVRQKIEDLKKQKEEFSLKLKEIRDSAEQIKNKEDLVKKDLEDLKKDLDLLENEKRSLTPKAKINIDDIDDPLPLLRKERAKLKRELSEYESKKANNEEEQAINGEFNRLKSEIYKLEIKINNIEIEAMRFAKLKKLPAEQIDEKIQSKMNQIERKKQELEKITKEYEDVYSGQFNNECSEKRLERDIKDMYSALERQAQLPRGAEILAILRGEKEGELTMQDAQLLCSIVNTILSRDIYRGPADVRLDVGQTKLREALYNSDWRGLRVGGYGHWWVYIRNPDGRTVDEINDSHVYRKRMTIDELFNKYSNPDEWPQTQITFYDGLKP
ncbi:hypothetical protein [Candidatus Protochlamydia phocaeensis]|uniref:hypothetical protein n=1 Tax=Candidatus Protochlamydia phocaeensis TaxID=1414722 RepID=UPI0008394581|nr:hypothetical protein [Candidatus Protochlamydia phocaeensis]